MSVERWGLLLIIAMGIHVIGFWILLFMYRKSCQQVRCLHYCFVGISDWGISTLKQVRDDYIEEHGRDHTPFALLDVEKEWDKEISFFIDLQKRAGVRVPVDNHIHYFDEDLRLLEN